MEYNEEDFLQLSGIQHFIYCRRQWALIHIEQQWKENARTVDGALMHRNVHNPEYRTKRRDVLTVRGLKIHSRSLGISGECDAVEFIRNDEGIPLSGTEGMWKPYPVEFKRGAPKADLCDEAQLCAQALCLEEMFCCDIKEGALYYGEPRRRTIVLFSEELRTFTAETFAEMHQLFRRGYTPAAKIKKGCNACSLKDICLPELKKSTTVKYYMDQVIRENM